jgi:hypothetical protein
MEIC